MAYNLLVHSEYSMYKSLIAIDKLINYAKEHNLKALAIADDSMYATYKFYQACINNNIKPIIGVNVRLDEFKNVELVIFAKTTEGYINLLSLISVYRVNGKITHNDLLKFAKDNICLLLLDNIDQLRRVTEINFLRTTFNELYLGVTKEQINDLDLIKQKNIYNLKLVALNHINYFEKDDVKAYLTLDALKNKINHKRFNFDCDYHFLSSSELENIYQKDPMLLENTQNIAEQINLTIPKNERIIPRFSDEDSNALLERLAIHGLNKRPINKTALAIYEKRLDKELQIIKKLNFADYFLIVRDYVLYAKKQGILVGPGRGSAASSLVSYLLGITDVDPIKYNLLFERFLNLERLSMPDIDVDFPDDKRDLVIKYVQERYGMLRVSHIATFSTFGLKNTIKEVANVFELSKIKENEILKCLKEIKDENLDEFIQSEKTQALMNDYPDCKNVIEISAKIANLPKNVSTHAAGIIIASDDLIKFSPIEKGPADGLFQTAYEASDLENLGLLKMDFLSLRNLNIIDKMLKMIKNEDPNFKKPTTFDDPKTLNLLTNGNTNGIFQFESESMKKMLKKIRVNSFEDLCQAMALNRPGPLSEIDTYASRKLGKMPINYLHPSLEEILKPTYGIILFQEQIILIACKFAGYSLGEADILRRAISKKKKDVMLSERTKFVDASVHNGYDANIASQIFDYIEKFADYGFVRAHSVSYSMIAYLMAYLKANYPKCFYSVILDDAEGTVAEEVMIKEMKEIGLNVLPPNINYSTLVFEISKNSLILPLNHIKGVSKNLAQTIIDERNKGEFSSYADFIKRLGKIIPQNIMENMIFSSALDGFKISKKSMIENYQKILERSKYAFVKNVSEISYDLEEYGYGYLLNKEKEVLNVNIKYNYFVQYQKLYDQKIVTKINAINSEYVKILAKINKIKTITTKTKELMAFMEVSDDSGKIEVIVFPSMYDAIKDLKSDMVVLIEGKIALKEGVKQLTMNSVKQV